MLPDGTIPGSLADLLVVFRSCFTCRVLRGAQDEHEGGAVDEHEQATVRTHGAAVVFTLLVMSVDATLLTAGTLIP
jgi:hypothetical protein